MYTYTESFLENQFITLLVKQGLYTEYMRSLAYNDEDRNCRSWNQFKQYLQQSPNSWISGAFFWSDTAVPEMQWYTISKAWDQKLAFYNFITGADHVHLY